MQSGVEHLQELPTKIQDAHNFVEKLIKLKSSATINDHLIGEIFGLSLISKSIALNSNLLYKYEDSN